MFTTASWSGKSNRCGTRASRSFGPMSGSVLMIVNTRSMTSRNSAGELNAAIAASYIGLVWSALRPRTHGLFDFLDRLSLDIAHAFPAHPEEPFTVRLRDALGELDDEAPVLVGLRGRSLGRDRGDAVADLG